MKIDYRREIKHNYLIVDPEELFWQGYESQMLSRNHMEGVLHFQIRQTDEGARFYYEITSKQPLSRILGNRSIQADEIRCLIIGIFSVLNRMEPYLLGEGNILLNPEYLYVEPDTFRVWLCLIPGLGKNFPEDFSKLLEYLLGCVDHQDKDSVVLAYGLYQETRKANYGLDDIMRLLRQGKIEKGPNRKKVAHTPLDEGKGYGKITQKNYNDKGMKGPLEETGWWEEKSREDGTNRGDAGDNLALKKQGKYKEADRKEYHHAKKEDISKKGKAGQKEKSHYEDPSKRNGWKSHWNHWKNRIFSQSSHKEEDLPIREPWEMMFPEEEETPQFPLSSLPSPPQSVSMVLQAQPASQETVLLSDFSKDSGQRMLRALDIDGEDILIPYYPFIIGKQENLVDFKLNRDTVSRLHLRIDQQDGIYRIKDLNSTNGTLLCGRLLENNEEAELHAGDEIRIARYRYRFE